MRLKKEVAWRRFSETRASATTMYVNVLPQAERSDDPGEVDFVFPDQVRSRGTARPPELGGPYAGGLPDASNIAAD